MLRKRPRTIERLETRYCLTALGFVEHTLQTTNEHKYPIVADVDGDGRDDVIAELWQGGVGINLGSETGVGAQTRLSADGELLAVQDLDGDGDLDILAQGATLYWLENDGQATSFPRHNLPDAPTMNRPNQGSLQVGDIDGDGQTDLVYLESPSQLITVFGVANELSTQVVTTHLIEAVSSVGRVQLTDFEADGKLEVVVEDSIYFVWNGTSHEPGPTGLLPDGRGMKIADTDHDQFPDIFFVDGPDLQHYELSSDRSHFEFRNTVFQRFDRISYVTVGDANGDGLDDLFFSSAVGGGGEATAFHVAENSATGFSGASTQGPIMSVDYTRSQIGDLTGDGKDDRILFHGGGIRILGQDEPVVPPNFIPLGMDSGDLDGDGDEDFVAFSSVEVGVVGPSQRLDLAWYENLDGQGTFAAPRFLETSLRDPTGRLSNKLVDFNDDGLLDIVGEFGEDLFWIRNTGSEQRFEAARILANDVGEAGLDVTEVVDLDLDGLLEIIVRSDRDREVVSFEQIAANVASLAPPTTLVRTSLLSEVRVADLDNDGRQDLIVSRNRELTWYRNDVDGQFRFVNQIDSCNNCRLEVVDVDTDGDLDVLATERLADVAFRLYENTDGAGTFAAAVDGPSRDLMGIQGRSRHADLDSDGDIDLLMKSGAGVFWVENRDGQFAAAARLYAAEAVYALDVADFNQDGQLDWVSAAHHGSFGVRWHERRLIGDVNQDNRFDSQDLVSIFTAGFYEEERLEYATFESGDFNGDGLFNSADLVVAFQVGHYET